MILEEKNDTFNELDSYKGQWFVINCNSGNEERVRQDLLEKIKSLSEYVFDVRVAKGLVQDKNGKMVEKNKFPGYLFINMIINEETWFIIRNTPGVTGFIGSSGKGTKPHPLTTEEVNKMLYSETIKTKSNSSSLKKEKKLFTANFKENDFVIVTAGVLDGKEGQVVKMDYEKGVATINVEMFGRYTKSEVNFEDLKIIEN